MLSYFFCDDIKLIQDWFVSLLRRLMYVAAVMSGVSACTPPGETLKYKQGCRTTTNSEDGFQAF